jgi:quercetin dioxygenase-like cupin family protein
MCSYGLLSGQRAAKGPLPEIHMNFFKTGFLLVLAVAFAFVGSATGEEAVSYKNLLTPLLQTGTDILDQPIVYPTGTPKITSAIVTIPPGGETGWHTHEVPLFVYILEGAVTVDYGGDKGIKTYKAGSAIMEAMDWPHNGMNKGIEPVRIMAVYMGADGKINAAPAAAPQ